MDEQKIYFPNLNGLRFIAAFLVIIHHIEQFKLMSKMDNYWLAVPFIRIIGNLGVILFFVLSGFLITYLLLAEEHSFKTISIKEFYIRRILRIWPLYFLIIALAFLILPNIHLFTLPGFGKNIIYSSLIKKLLLYALFLPNLALSFLGIIPYASQAWSIGAEEQYYLVWPLILKYVNKNRLLLIVGIIISYTLFTNFLATSYSDFLPYKSILSGFWGYFNIDCMAIGAVYAILLFKKDKLLNVLSNKYLFYFTILLLLVFMINGVYIPYVHNEVYSILFGIIILNFASNKKTGISLENKAFDYLGKISYGLYMYHPIAIVLALFICRKINLTTNWLAYPLSFILTITLAGLSYKYYEKYFLKFKLKFSKITSGNGAKP